MQSYSLAGISDDQLFRDTAVIVVHDRATTAKLLVHLAEIDLRRGYRSKGFTSMRAYCIGELRFSEDAAAKRIQAARHAREFPMLFAAVADGRLHLAAVCLLGPYLGAETVDQLVELATHRSKAEIELMLARRFPRSETLTLTGSAGEIERDDIDPSCQHAPGHVGMTTPEHAPREHAPSRIQPLAPERFALHTSVGGETYRKLRHAQALLGHSAPSCDIADVLDRALDALIEKLEKRKFGATNRPRMRRSQPSPGSRYIPAEVRRAVWQRDAAQCTFVAADGRRCAARERLEFDHVLEVARGGDSTVANLRLCCRAHNALAAEQSFGAEFMRAKRDEARRVAAMKRAAAKEERVRAREAEAQARAEAAALEADPNRSVIPWLRGLGIRLEDARRAAAGCAHLVDAPMEERVRAALAYAAPPRVTHGLVGETAPAYTHNLSRSDGSRLLDLEHLHHPVAEVVVAAVEPRCFRFWALTQPRSRTLRAGALMGHPG